MSEKPAKGSFVLFKTIKREGDHPKRPHYTGSVELPDGTKFDLAGWINEGRAGSKIQGQKYIKGEVNPPWVPQALVKIRPRDCLSHSAKAESPAPKTSAPANDMAEDDIPF